MYQSTRRIQVLSLWFEYKKKETDPLELSLLLKGNPIFCAKAFDSQLDRIAKARDLNRFFLSELF